MEKYGFVYLWRDRKHNRYYIGSHWGTEDDGYICSSNWMRKSYKRRPEDFKRRIISRIYTNRKDTFLKEDYYIKMIKQEERGKKYYNIHLAGHHWSSDDFLLEKFKNRIVSAETREKMRQKRLGIKQPKEFGLKVSASKLNKRTSIKSEFKKGYIMSEEVKRKKSDALAKEYFITNPIGEKFKIKGLVRFCKENNLNCSSMLNVSSGIYKQHKGYKVEKCVIGEPN